jgi:predicted nicotinamide N-methyase
MPAFAPGFQTRPLPLDVEGLAVQLSVITNTAELMDELIAKGSEHEDVQDERIPYWADLWPSALALSRHLVRSGLVRPGVRVTEIGCGLGLPGIVAGLLGAETTLTDYLPDALRFAHHNWGQNLSRPARFELMDWRQPDPALAADLLLASDVAYESRAFGFLPQAFRMLCRPGGTILLSEPNRAVAAAFLDDLAQQGFQVEPHLYKGVFEGYTYGVKVYALRIVEEG